MLRQDRSSYRLFAVVLLAILCLAAGGIWHLRRQSHFGPTHNNTANQISSVEKLPVVPSSTAQSAASELAEQYEHVDPMRAGWETEAFSEIVESRLKDIGKLLTGPPHPETYTLPEFIGDEFSCNRLRPSSLVRVFADSCLAVYRTGNNESDQVVKTADLVQELAILTECYTEDTDIRVKFKVVRIDRKQDTASTVVYYQSAGRNSTSTTQQSADWHCIWALGSEDVPPRLVSVRVTDYEEVRHDRAYGHGFVDLTEAVLGDNPSWQDQLIYGIDHWRGRMTRMVGPSIRGHHGIAIGDANGDGFEDLYVCRPRGLPDRLFLQNPDGTATDVSAEANVEWLEDSRAALFLDLDQDGDQDLVVSCQIGLLFLSNDGTGCFSLMAKRFMSDDPMSLAAADYDNDRYPDIYVCGTIPIFSVPGPNFSAADDSPLGVPIPYHDAENGGRNVLFRNMGDWQFVDVTGEVGLDVDNRRWSFAASWDDFDSDGDQDLYVANDNGRNNLYRNDAGFFVDVAMDSGVEDMAAGMSVSWGDFNNDGQTDLYVSNMFSSAGNRIAYQRQFQSDARENVRHQFRRHARGNTLFENAGNGTFRDVSVEQGVTMGRWAWASRFVDINNDGFEDIIVANGYVTQEDTGDL